MDEQKTPGAAETPEKPVKPAKKQVTIVDDLKFVASVVLVGFVIRCFAYQPFNIPSESMVPTFLVGDYLLVSKYSYGYSMHSFDVSFSALGRTYYFSLPKMFDGRIFESKVERGDVAVFKLPRDGKTDFIKRIIGLPGDRLQMLDGRLYINGTPVKRERIEDYVFTETPNSNCSQFPGDGPYEMDLSVYRVVKPDGTSECHYPRYRETLPNGKAFDTLDFAPYYGAMDTTREYYVPEGYYFGIGDNRDNSQDSRFSEATGVGLIPAENLIGRAEVRFFSTDGTAKWWQPWKWVQAMRFERFFTKVN